MPAFIRIRKLLESNRRNALRCSSATLLDICDSTCCLDDGYCLADDCRKRQYQIDQVCRIRFRRRKCLKISEIKEKKYFTNFKTFKAILLQVILQLALLAHFHGRMTQIVNKVDRNSKEIVAGDGISWAVWTIFILYSLFNVFGVPVILSYIDRRERQEALLGPKTESEIEVN
jgi:hypothetical protein